MKRFPQNSIERFAEKSLEGSVEKSLEDFQRNLWRDFQSNRYISHLKNPERWLQTLLRTHCCESTVISRKGSDTLHPQPDRLMDILFFQSMLMMSFSDESIRSTFFSTPPRLALHRTGPANQCFFFPDPAVSRRWLFGKSIPLRWFQCRRIILRFH